MKDLFTIQTESGQLWLDIKAQLDAKDAELAKLTASHAEAIAAKDAKHLEAIAAKDAQLKTQATEADAARTTARELHAAELARLTDSHTEALAAKDAQLKAQEDEAWDTINAVDEAIAAKDAQHAADLASAVEAEARAVHNRLDALVQAGQEAHAKGDLDALGKVLVAAYAHTSKARKAKLETELASAQDAVKAAADKLAAL